MRWQKTIGPFFLPISVKALVLKRLGNECLGQKLGVARGPTARKTLQLGPTLSTRKCSCQKLANRCPTLGQLLASRILYALLVGEKQYEIARARFCTQSCSKVGHLVARAIRNAIRANRFARIDSQLKPLFHSAKLPIRTSHSSFRLARITADSHESLRISDSRESRH